MKKIFPLGLKQSVAKGLSYWAVLLPGFHASKARNEEKKRVQNNTDFVHTPWVFAGGDAYGGKNQCWK